MNRSDIHSGRDLLKDDIRRVVIKLGSRVLVSENGEPDRARIQSLIGEVAALYHEGKEVILVSSGAIATGVQALGWSVRPTNLQDLQMSASVGQTVLMQIYSSLFGDYGIQVGQVLLTHDDLKQRERHLNARNTMLSMLRNRVIPVVNENDVVSVDEIRFGDNDLLASLVATLTGSELLILLTTSNGFFRTERGVMKERIPVLSSITGEVISMAQGKGSTWSSGGMASKLKSAEHAVRSGIPVVIANGQENGVLARILAKEDVGTLILPDQRGEPMTARKKWIAFFHRPVGALVVDKGACKAIVDGGNSLLPVGVQQCRGRFGVGALLNIEYPEGVVIARGITSYSKEELEEVMGLRSPDIRDRLGERYHEEVIHRDNMVIL
ncbi:MAG: glutamate 5-kinase [Balneolaceae bacterium]